MHTNILTFKVLFAKKKCFFIFEDLIGCFVWLKWQNTEKERGKSVYMLPTMCFYRQNMCVPGKLMCWNPHPNVMVRGSGAIGRELGHEGGVLLNSNSDLPRVQSELVLFLHTVRIWSSVNWEKSPHQELNHIIITI